MTPPLQRSELIAAPALGGRRFCEAHTDQVDVWLADLFAAASPPDGVALVAVGGHGRRELAPQSDLDLLLLVGRGVEAAGVADSLWYPIWDTGLKLGHAVRTVRDTLTLASGDLETATALLSARHLAGDPTMSAELIEKARTNWRKRGKRWLAELSRSVTERHRAAGEVAFDLEPDLKEGRGGLRDVHALRWARDAGADVPDKVLFDLEGPYDVLLDARVELHRATSKPDDKLTMADQDAIASALVDSCDADDLMAGVAAAARTIAWVSDETWHEIDLSLDAGFIDRFRSGRPIAGDLVLQGGRIHLLDPTAPVTDPAAQLHVGVAAARAGARIGAPTIEALRAGPDLPEPWPAEARDAFVDLLATGHAAIPVVEALDQAGLWVRLLREWAPTRSRPQRNVFHRFTVDRHLLECAAEAAALAPRTPRPDLLAVAALLHDIGKAHPGDHSEVGEGLSAAIVQRLGFSAEDGATVGFLTRHHLLLPDVATRRDLDDPATIEMVARLVGTPERLALLHALTEADGRATGPTAWGSWKADLVEVLAVRVARLLAGAASEDVIEPGFPSDAQRARMRARVTEVTGKGDRVTIVCPDRRGLFSRVAGVLSLHDLDVVEANVHTERGMALEELRVSAGGSGLVAWERVEADLRTVLTGRFALEARLEEHQRTRRRPHTAGLSQMEPSVRFDNDHVSDATVIEAIGPDEPGLLYRLTRALTDLDLVVQSAKIHTVGGDAVDTFYVTGSDGSLLEDPSHQSEVERALLHVLAPSH